MWDLFFILCLAIKCHANQTIETEADIKEALAELFYAKDCKTRVQNRSYFVEVTHMNDESLEAVSYNMKFFFSVSVC